MRNHDRPFRPVRGGTAVFNPNVGVLGTLGLIASSNGLDRWIVSCYHVLGRANLGKFSDNEPVMQGDLMTPIARLKIGRASTPLDCIAAEIDPSVGGVGDILGLPPVLRTTPPMVGMRVTKSGRDTGITEGTVHDVNGTDVVIRVSPGFPPGYELSGLGDSGSVWVERTTGAAVALHRAGNAASREAFGIDFQAVLATLGLGFT